MPRIPVEAAAKYSATPKGIDILNVIRANADSAYQERVPLATQNNINDVGNPIMKYQAVRNAFLSELINRIGLTLITNRTYNNPLKPFKRGEVTLGETVQEIFVNIIKAEPYYQVDTQGKTDSEDLYGRRLPDVKNVFHTRNRQDKYSITVSNDDLRAAFISYEGVESLVSKIITTLYTSDEYDEYLLMKNVFYEAGLRGAIKAVPIADYSVSETNAKKAMIAMRTTAKDITFMSKDFNFMGVTTHTPVEDQYIFLLSSFEASVDVEVLASAFNMDKADFIGRRMTLDNFGGLEKEGVVALLVDREWFMVFDNYLAMTEVYNGARLYWNYFLHHWETLSYSPFKTAIAYVTTAPTITSVTVSPTTATVSSKTTTTLQGSAAVVGTGLFDPNVIWSAATYDGVSVDANGLVTIIGGSAAGSAVITATSKQDATKKGTITITITA